MKKENHKWIDSFCCTFTKLTAWVDENAATGLKWCYDGKDYNPQPPNGSKSQGPPPPPKPGCPPPPPAPPKKPIQKSGKDDAD